MTAGARAGTICVSVVSHGHAGEVTELLKRLAADDCRAVGRVVLTLNTPEPQWESQWHQAWPFDLQLLRNTVPRGFGANHNHAFARDAQRGAHRFFAVLNPDVGWTQAPWDALVQQLERQAGVGLAYPLQTDARGAPADFERKWPTPTRLLRRYSGLRRRRETIRLEEEAYWVNAACLLVRQGAYADVGGFDERYRLYCEDVDFCLRLRLAGWAMQRVPTVKVQHTGRRASHRQWRHLLWHLQGLWRFWQSDAWRHYSQRA